MKDFVPFEIAKKLEEKGFNPQKQPNYLYYNGELVEVKDHYNISPYEYASTISQVLKWLREEKLILIGLSPMQEYDVEETIEWCATVYKADKQGGLSLKEELYYESYEQAAIAGIEYVIDNDLI